MIAGHAGTAAIFTPYRNYKMMEFFMYGNIHVLHLLIKASPLIREHSYRL
jgi:hypothetical protein